MKRNLGYLFCLSLIALILTACGRDYYLHPQFASETSDHTKVVVLPTKMIFTGKVPKGVTDEQIEEVEEAESMAFQKSLYQILLRESGPEKKDIGIEFMDPGMANSLIKARGISVRQSWESQPEVLAKALGVDAVIRAEIVKTRYLTDLESFGIETAKELLRIFAPQVWPFAPDVSSTTETVEADCALYDGLDGTVLWRAQGGGEVNWESSSEQIIAQINRRFSRRFPYRNDGKN